MNNIDRIRFSLSGLLGKIGAISGEGYEEQVRSWLMSAALRIWSANQLYSESYLQAFSAVAGHSFTAAQVITALDCAGEENRRLEIPKFFQEAVLADCSSFDNRSRGLVLEIGQILADMALVNGDFTIEEARELSAIVNMLEKHCDEFRIAPGDAIQHRPEMLTELSETGYHMPAPKKKASAPKIEIKENDVLVAPPVNPRQEPVRPVTTVQNEEPVKPQDPTEPTVGVNFSRPQDDKEQNETLQSVLEELRSLVGLDKVKEDVQVLLNFIRICRLRTERGMKVPTVSYHLVFTGNPGTGKTTVARMVAKLYYMMGILPSGQLVETDRSGLVAGYLGQTAIKTQKVIQEALGGVLFIDEAYSLANDKEDSYGKEAIETILKAMEDHRNELVVIVAGYDDLMHKFIDSNPGLRSRFNKYFHFPDYDGDDLLRILERFCSTNGYALSPETIPVLKQKLDAAYQNRAEHFGNARSIRNLFEHAINHQASRLVLDSDITNEELANLTIDDILPALEVL